MAFVKKEWKLISAPLNYQTPGDKIGERYSLMMSNFRIDGKGRITCRRGMEQVGGGVASPIHSIMKAGHAVGAYLGSGTSLYADQGGTDLGASFDGSKVGFATGDDYAYFMNRNGPKKRLAGGALEDWSILEPTSAIGTATGTGSGSGNGDYFVYVTFLDVNGNESNPSEGIEVTLSNQQLALTGIPTSGNANVIARRIYIGGGALPQVLLLVEIHDNTTTTYTVNVDEDIIVLTGIEMPTNHDPVPAGRILAGPYFQRLIIGSTAEEPHAYWWTETNAFGYVPATNKNYIGGADTDLLGFTHHKRMIIFYKPDGIWRLQNDPATTGDQEQCNAGFGAVGLHAMVAAGAQDYFIGPRGVYLFDGDKAIEISQPIRALFEDDRYIPITGSFSTLPWSSDPNIKAKAAIGWDSHYIWVSYAEQGQSENNRTLIFDPQSNEWRQYRNAAALGSGEGFACFAYDSANDIFFGAGHDGKFYHLEHGATDGPGTAVPVAYFSHYEDFALPDNEKIIDDVVIEGDARGQNLTVKVWTNDGAGEFGLGTFNKVGFSRDVFTARDSSATNDVGLRCRNFAIDLNGDIDALEGLYISQIIIHYRVEQRSARTFDTGPFDLGTAQVKSLREFEFDITSAQNITWKLYSDLPHNKLTQRTTGTILHTGGQRSSRFIKLAAPVDGIRFRLTFEVPLNTEFNLHQAWVRALPIGEFVSGFAGDNYESEELSFG